jgi:hypothetical protein
MTFLDGLLFGKNIIILKKASGIVGIAMREVNPNRKICNFFGHYTLYTKSGEIQVILQQI